MTNKSIPLPNFEASSNRHVIASVRQANASINPNAPATRKLDRFEVNNNTILDTTNAVQRGVSFFEAMNEEGGAEVKKHNFIPNVTSMSVYSDPVAPVRFPQAEDVIKSLKFSSSASDATTKEKIGQYYQLVAELLNGDKTPEEYYAKMPSLIESIKDYTLNETDWEALRDSILGVQRYLISFIWGDMQRISRKMDEGFAEYQKELNTWIDNANEYYSDPEFIPNGAIKLHHFGRASTGGDNDKFQVQQNVRYLVDGMCVQMSKTKPSFVSGNGEGDDGINHYPTNKGLVWLEELS